MPVSRLVDRSADVTLGERRAEVAQLLRAAAAPLSAAEVAERTGLHLNTARFHLEGLVTDGLASRTTEGRDAPGRPRVLYAAAPARPGTRSYELLAEMLTGLVASVADAGPAAAEVGRSWGRHLVDRPAPSERVPADEAVTRLNDLLAAIGFEPQLHPGAAPAETEVQLHHCPFREVAERHTDVVCALHLGLMQGALGELGGTVEATSLDPWVTPDLCVGHLRALEAAAS